MSGMPRGESASQKTCSVEERKEEGNGGGKKGREKGMKGRKRGEREGGRKKSSLMGLCIAKRTEISTTMSSDCLLFCPTWHHLKL